MLHYTFTRFSDLKARRDRCDCAPTEEDAKRCFILPFDRMVRRPARFVTDACGWRVISATVVIVRSGTDEPGEHQVGLGDTSKDRGQISMIQLRMPVCTQVLDGAPRREGAGLTWASVMSPLV